jgi:putative hydrolase of the HAD superfamily
VVIETILFDLDDTLIEELEWARGGWALVARALADRAGRPPAELERMMAGFFAADHGGVLDRLAGAVGLDQRALADCIELYRTGRRPLSVTADAETALAFAGARRTAIVTDGLERTQRTKVECAGLAGRVEEIVYTGALGPGAGKPSTTGFAVALRRLGMPARSALYVADNPRKDFVGPRRLGMRTLQVRRAGGVYAGETAPPGGEAEAVVQSLAELAAVVAAFEHDGARDQRSKPPPPS